MGWPFCLHAASTSKTHRLAVRYAADRATRHDLNGKPIEGAMIPHFGRTGERIS